MSDRAEIMGMLVIGLSGGSVSEAVEWQEKRGQAELVNSTMLPVEGCEAALEKMGITIGERADDLFHHVILPPGWRKERTDHSMWSHLLDAGGNVRAEIFYKAAFYDRRANMRLCCRYTIDTEYAVEGEYDGDRRVIVRDNQAGRTMWAANNWYAREEGMYAKVEKQRAEAEAWLDETHPNWGDATAYWGKEA